jgi:hypothetical protein
MSLSAAITQFQQLAEAVALCAERTSLAQTAVGALVRLTDDLEAAAGRLTRARDKAAHERDVGHLTKEEDQRQREAETMIRSLAQVLGEASTADLARAAIDLDRRVRDLREAEQRGILGHRETEEAVRQLESDYAKLQRVALGQDLGGTAGKQAVQAMHAAPGAAFGVVRDQAAGVLTGVMGLIGTLPIAGGLFGLMLWGRMEADRLSAEAGEMANLVVGAGGTVHDKAVGYLAAFQERAQKFYGVSRQDVQGVVKTFFDAGLRVEDVMGVTHQRLGEVGHDAMTTTLALDRHFELANGSTARGAVRLVTQHGMSLERAVDQMMRMSFAGQRAGVGVAEFTEASLAISGELHAFGVDGEQVASLLLTVQQRFQAAGLRAGAAFNLSETALRDVSAGFRGMAVEVKATLGEFMGLGDGMAARLRLEDSIRDDDPERLRRMVQAANVLARRETAGTAGSFGSDETRQRMYLEQSLGFSFEAAQAMTALDGHLGDDVRLGDLKAREWGQLKDALKTEGQKVSEIQKAVSETVAGMARMGQNLLVLVANFAALAILGIKAILGPDLRWEVVAAGAGKAAGGLAGLLGSDVGQAVEGMTRSAARGALGLGGRSEAMRRFESEFAVYWNDAAAAAAGVLEGADQSAGGLGKIAGPILRPLAQALRLQVPGGPSSERDWAMSDEERVQAALWGSDAGGQEVAQGQARAGAPAVVQRALARVGHRQKGDEASELSFGRREWWCMDFVGWAYEQAGFTEWGSFHKSMWTDQEYKGYKGIEAWARRTGHWHDAIGYVPRPGDVFFIERYTGETGVGFIGEHVGMVVDILEDGTLLTVEGNAVQNGINGVWQHKRDPSKSVFRGFITTRLAGVSRASAAAKAKYLATIAATAEKKKTNQLRARAERVVRERKQVADITARAVAEGRTYLAPEDAVSRAPEGGAGADRSVAPPTATLMQTPAGPEVTVELDPAALAKKPGVLVLPAGALPPGAFSPSEETSP